MPIRTPRGRAAAYRGLWQWPLRSPARLAMTLVVVAALAAGLSFALTAAGGGSASGKIPPIAMAPTPTYRSTPQQPLNPSSSPAPTALPPVAELQPTALPVSQAPQAALDVAAAWTAAWVRPPAGTPAGQWLEGLRATTTPEYMGVLAGVDPGNIPSTKVTGPPKAVSVSPKSVRVEVPTDALTLTEVLINSDVGWRVSSYERT
ncbi:hypothetical protein [Pseudonocardia sp. GCM10023141]|uniref:hypothetical protein n=1 Tax=Pseudonocardia sp. GCM10023141 TaxID=3252653 RepID=UPI0036064F8E